jgi:predicted ATP-binding protein involved in virulence/transcriptional regulator with XRE-family HTH domain
MQNKIYHTGIKLQTLRELKGLKEKELAEALGNEFNDIILWESEGIPEGELLKVLDFFEISNDFFITQVLNSRMLQELALSELARPALEKDLRKRLEKYKAVGSVELDLSALGLSTVPDYVFSLPRLAKLNLSNNFLTEIPANLQDFIDNGGELIVLNNYISSTLPNIYNEKKQPAVAVSKKEATNVDKIRLVSLRLVHIGIYEDITIDFNEDLTVLIGINGAGKTTILKAISLAILGARESVNTKAVLLRSIGIQNTTDSVITLTASVDGIEYSNEIILSHNSDIGEVTIIGTSFKQLYDKSFTLKNLILCLGEQRNNSNANEKLNLDNSPRVLDLLPLLRGEDQSCMKDFTSWWANLETNKSSTSNNQATINLCFEIFSKFMGEEIQSAGLKKVKPNTELWLKYSSGKSVPFHLESQGYQSVMGWIGFIIQRMTEANENYPLPLSQSSIVIIDEIDQLLSIKWQQKILSILMEYFPNTQWIISTHSPMVLTDLNKHQVVQLHEKNGKIIAKYNEVDLWMWQYGDIIRRYFEISTTPPKYQEECLNKQIDLIKNVDLTPESEAKLFKLEERLGKLQASAAAADKLEEQLQSLKKREKELVDLMSQLRSEKK